MHRPLIAAVGMFVIGWAGISLAAPCAGFIDVDSTDPFCDEVTWMKNRSITLGLTPTLYAPNAYVTRLQMAAFMYRLGYENAFLQGGNQFGASAVLGTTDIASLDLLVASRRVMELRPNPPGTPGAANILGGIFNTVAVGAHTNFIGNGQGNQVTGGFGVIAGGLNNHVGERGAVPGGSNNHAIGSYSFAAGANARANHDHCFVWSGFLGATSCFASGEVVMNGVGGGFYFWTAGTNDNNYSGARLASGTGAWAAYSDRDGKQAIDLVDSRAVLEKLVAMPIATWQWRAEPGDVRHMGPMAQDFRAAFGLGDSDKQIVTVDADGVALAAIQGLNAKLEAERAAKDEEVAVLRADLRALRAELADLRFLKEEVATIRAAQARDSSPSDRTTAKLVQWATWR